MCTIYTKITNKSLIRKGLTGYKIAVKKDNRYYSPVTGIEYKIGEIEQPKLSDDLSHFAKVFQFVNVLSKNEITYNPLMCKLKLTGLIISINGAEREMYKLQQYSNTYNLILLKICIRRNLHTGQYHNHSLYLGSYIVSLEEIN